MKTKLVIFSIFFLIMNFSLLKANAESPALITAAPTTPKEATFDDEYSPDDSISPELLKSLAPVTPGEADFNDADEDATICLAPVTPSIADFTDLD